MTMNFFFCCQGALEMAGMQVSDSWHILKGTGSASDELGSSARYLSHPPPSTYLATGWGVGG